MMRSTDKGTVTLLMLAQAVVAMLGLGAISAYAVPPSEELQQRAVGRHDLVQWTGLHAAAAS